jgi:CRP-like cAMP-binding protein
MREQSHASQIPSDQSDSISPFNSRLRAAGILAVGSRSSAANEIGRGRRPIEQVYFPDSGILSVVANGDNKQSIEVGLIGREDMTGMAVVMGADRSPHQTFVQSAGRALKIGCDDLRGAIRESPTLHRQLLLYGHAYMLQTAYTAMANGRSKIEDRTARLLLMAQDRMDGDTVTLTHEYLSTMLGVRRPGVTHALNLLERSGLIQTNRSRITITDREGLIENSNGAYGTPEAEFNRLFG